MIITKTDISEVLIIDPSCYGDHRGWFMETYNHKLFVEAGITCNFVQDNHSYSAQKGTLRGLHFQNNPMAQSKLVRCTKGVILDVAVDIRVNSPTYKKWVSVELSADNKRQLFIPRGFAHGFITLTDDVEVQYKVDNLYSKEHDRGIIYNDSDINVDWGSVNPILSEKDSNSPNLSECDYNFMFEE
ncbi:dTDP-4-dehydrorhamnose 3,5-epimerase [Proteiniclasticum ruminis]|uniref:dTDP-4-dehydrorhamnose 3,5-epimerase n=1 Tax=Proteiniclasticum ruminis TaxID=398199 RepID=UPI0028A72012|nr:dTDP-4-dehydrorhamnose 3,5-epimerase [Proteiniclasticum ruminis]